jgi:hypothetical protein
MPSATHSKSIRIGSAWRVPNAEAAYIEHVAAASAR